jgi:hypothetical protein
MVFIYNFANFQFHLLLAITGYSTSLVIVLKEINVTLNFENKR